ncbi:hypothetical protein [Mesorhizobium sp.]|uniref:hypothetical protein n=1 Tax=Mesorhizobium sp. TaxID=1871066 RepID=UPI000FE48C40|nr:hypothetical protein [Mesorhizobium sp.]RWG44149.1 MAG: hypothetical protein EOQ62_21695 [Mesorhizobium sp.]RWJ33181.1 MAG: hypothetical protein EOR28_11390 [Mesorhizobium sp.]TIQ64447.1 MAG: hypothetical protein E5X41_17450 [Mesorhizobium sp.]TIQ68227.1 MAG: hypothetical protein E5X40_29880 [Mesorhizobium sp.]
MSMERVPVSFTLDGPLCAGLERRAKSMGKRPADYIRMLCEAAYLARVGREKNLPATDHDLDQAVRAVFCLAGEFNVATIAHVTGLPAGVVDNALRGFKLVAKARAQKRSA